MYLRHSLKDRTAKSVIEGLSHSGDQYREAIDSLKARCDRPCVIHQLHVRKICDVPNLKDGLGKEIRRFHDVINSNSNTQSNATDSFITSLLELKLDKDTMFEWQKASQEIEKIPHSNDLLKFLNLCAQASETCSSEQRRHYPQKKNFPYKSATTFVANASESPPICSICKTLKHPLCACPQFKLLTHDKMYDPIMYVSNLATSQRIVEPTIAVENARGHTTLYFTSKRSSKTHLLEKTCGTQLLP